MPNLLQEQTKGAGSRALPAAAQAAQDLQKSAQAQKDAAQSTRDLNAPAAAAHANPRPPRLSPSMKNHLPACPARMPNPPTPTHPNRPLRQPHPRKIRCNPPPRTLRHPIRPLRAYWEQFLVTIPKSKSIRPISLTHPSPGQSADSQSPTQNAWASPHHKAPANPHNHLLLNPTTPPAKAQFPSPVPPPLGASTPGNADNPSSPSQSSAQSQLCNPPANLLLNPPLNPSKPPAPPNLKRPMAMPPPRARPPINSPRPPGNSCLTLQIIQPTIRPLPTIPVTPNPPAPRERTPQATTHLAPLRQPRLPGQSFQRPPPAILLADLKAGNTPDPNSSSSGGGEKATIASPPHRSAQSRPRSRHLPLRMGQAATQTAGRTTPFRPAIRSARLP